MSINNIVLIVKLVKINRLVVIVLGHTVNVEIVKFSFEIGDFGLGDYFGL